MAIDTSRRDAVLEDVRQTLGLVPSFLDQLEFDPETLEAHWRLLKKYTLGETHLPAKTRELIEVAVAAAIHCRFSVTVHNEFARIHGATEVELQEAAYLAKHIAGWGAFVDGRLQDIEGVQQELALIRRHLGQEARPGAITLVPEAQESNSERLRHFIDAVFNRGDLEAAARFLAPDLRDHNHFPFQPPGMTGVQQGLKNFRAAFPDMRWTFEELFATGDRVACQLVMHGTHQGPFMGIPATGQAVHMGSTHLVRFEDGMQVEHRGTFDIVDLLRQLGASLPT